jgi:hypothetical protein
MMTTKVWSTGWSSSPYKRLGSPLPSSSILASVADSDFFSPLVELVIQERPPGYRSLTWPELRRYKKLLGHARP